MFDRFFNSAVAHAVPAILAAAVEDSTSDGGIPLATQKM
jgi:hypothetical protein